MSVGKLSETQLSEETTSKEVPRKKSVPRVKNVTKWETERIGQFLFELYLRGKLLHSNNFNIAKSAMHSEFEQFLRLPENVEGKLRDKFKQENGTCMNIGTILYRSNYLVNTPRGSPYYRIKSSTLMQYRHQKLAAYDDAHIKKVLATEVELIPDGEKNGLTDNERFTEEHEDPALAALFEVDSNATSHIVEYQGSALQERNSDFRVTNMGCYICEQNFDTAGEYEKHVEYHGDESDFEYLKTMEKEDSPIFKLSYQFCKNSHYICFKIESACANIIVDKIIIVQSRSMFYVRNSRGSYPFPSSGTETFFVDDHQIVRFVEQPIVIVFHSESAKEIHSVEEHHFVHHNDFRSVPFGFAPHRVSNKTCFKAKIKLPQYLPPPEMHAAAKQQFPVDSLMALSYKFKDYVQNGQEYSIDNMVPAMRIILQVEDMETIKKYVHLMQTNVKLRRIGEEYRVKVKVGKNMFRDNIISPYDEVLVIREKPSTETDKLCDNVEPSIDMLLADSFDLIRKKEKVYHGLVERVNNSTVSFLCYVNIPENKTYKVIFRPARQLIRYQYRALELFAAMKPELQVKFIFPTCDGGSLQSVVEKKSLNLINKSIADTPEQYQAVQNILHGPYKSAPYILFGPPGTGKTTTLTEAILQLYQEKPKARILVTAGSNSACDELALRLVRVLSKADDPRAIARIYSRSNESRIDTIDDDLLEYSNMYAGQFYPDVDVLHEYRIVICTLSVVGKLGTGNFGHSCNAFSHVFIDEAAASTEAEVLVGIMGMLSARSSLIIAGDHKQLGAVMQSYRADSLGLGISFMERLLKRHCYRVDDKGDYDRSIQTRLCRNYRSHHHIVNLYNHLYYNNELMAMSDNDVSPVSASWHRSPNADYPIIFHSVFGTAARDNNSTSLYNTTEVSVVMDYVKDLMYFGVNGMEITESDIGIISPYKAQYLRIQDELNLRNWFQIETGSVESYQGREKLIIIVSFVRSFSKTLGFLESPNRLNVTLSRPQSLLILIGNPKTLSMNAEFQFIIDQCKHHKTLVGALIDPEKVISHSIGNLATSMESLSVKNAPAKQPKQKNKNPNKTVNTKVDQQQPGPKQAKKKYPKRKATTPAKAGDSGGNDKGNNSNATNGSMGVKQQQQQQQKNAGHHLGKQVEKRVATPTNTATQHKAMPKKPHYIDDIFENLPSVSRSQQPTGQGQLGGNTKLQSSGIGIMHAAQNARPTKRIGNITTTDTIIQNLPELLPYDQFIRTQQSDRNNPGPRGNPYNTQHEIPHKKKSKSLCIIA